MQIAIIGAGFTGLAVAWHLLQAQSASSIQVTVFDSAGIGGGTSGMAVGLLHPYAGLHAKLNRFGQEGLAATLKLLEVASKTLNQPVADLSGMLRLALDDSQQYDYAKCAGKYSDVEWLDAEQCQSKVKGLVHAPGILIKSALTVNCQLYLKGLWLACSQRGVKLECSFIKSLQELNSFDLIIAATGGLTKSIRELTHLPITEVKGQILEFAPPHTFSSLSLPLNNQAYLLQDPITKTFLAGATFEKNFSSTEPEPSVAIQEIMPRIKAFLPAFENVQILSCRSGIRASTPKHLPLIEKISPRCWTLTGMGSKGLLYHALYAERLISEILSTNFKL